MDKKAEIRNALMDAAHLPLVDGKEIGAAAFSLFGEAGRALSEYQQQVLMAFNASGCTPAEADEIMRSIFSMTMQFLGMMLTAPAYRGERGALSKEEIAHGLLDVFEAKVKPVVELIALDQSELLMEIAMHAARNATKN